MAKFLRRTSKRHVKLGKGRKKKQVWRKPTGRDNKMREKRKGYPAVVSVGYKKDKKLRNKISEKTPVMINNIGDLKNVKENQIAIISNVGKKKKIEIAKKAKEMKINIYNMNPRIFLKKLGDKKKKVVEIKKEMDKKPSEKTKKVEKEIDIKEDKK